LLHLAQRNPGISIPLARMGKGIARKLETRKG
jgi:hypothetical protein